MLFRSVNVQAMNVPDGYRLKMFPNSVSLVCKASLDELKNIESNDFEITADYKQLGASTNNSILLQVTKKPGTVYAVRLQQRMVNFVLERK